MIFLTNGNTPLNAAYADEIVQIDSNTYQLSFRFPTSDPLWEKLKEETFLTADDLHGEQDFVIFEVEKKHGYIQVYANQVFTLLNNYVVNPISLDRATGSTALSRFAGAITRNNPFSFFSDIEDRHTFNIGSKNAMEAFAKDKHSIIGQWGGDLVRHGYQVRLLKNGGSENESLFMYKKNLSSYQHKTSTKSLKTRITFKTTVKGEGEKAPDRKFSVVVDSPLINKYSQIYEDVIEVNDEDVKDEASLRKYGEQYFKTSLCDMMEDSLELEVVGQSDVPVQMYDIVSLFYEIYNLDVRKKITKYTYSPMAKKLKSIGFGKFQSGLANAIGNAVSDAVKGEAQQLQDDFERQLEREIKNADLAFDRQKEELVNQFTDGLNAAKAKSEEVKRDLSDNIDQRFGSFNNGPLQEAKRRAEEALRNAGASSLLAQEAKRIGLDSIAKLEELKRQATSAQMTLSSDLDALANEVLSKQEQIKDEVDEQVEALIQTKNELAGVKSAQATYEETTTRRLAELTNLANGKASKSELVQTAEELKSRIASVQVGGTNLYVLSKNLDIWKNGHVADFKMDISSGEISFKATGLDPYVGEATTHPRTASSRNGVRIPVVAGKSIYVTISNPVFAKNFISYFAENGNTVKHYQYYNTNSFVISPKELVGVSFVTLRFGCGGSNFEIGDVLKTKIKVEYGTIPTDWSPAPEDVENQISAVESTFKQRADSLEAGVSRLTEGLRTKADISSLNVTAENIRQSVKSLETSTQNKLDQKLSMTEFEVRAGSIHQEILNATKDKADKTLVMTEAGKLREEFSNLRVGGTNLLKGSKGPFLPDRKPANFDNAILYAGNTSIYMEQGQEYIVSAKTDGNFTALHENKESDNVVLWIMDKDVRNYQIVSDLKTGTTGTKIIWDKPTGIYHLRVNTYHKEATKSVWDVKIEKGNVATDWSPAPEDTDGLITEAKATFERTAQGLRTDLSAIQEYVNKDGQRQDALQRYTREESAKQATAVRELVTRDYVGKATYQEDVKGINQRIEAVKTSANKDIASQIASYRQSVDGKFTDISSQITTYKQDLGGQISGLSNRITSSEQGTTTQISNLSNRINSNKQGTDNQISNLKTQVATNKDNAERQMGRISDQVSANKANADSQFANVSNQLARKVETTDFQHVKETSQLYERILGNTENGIADKVARMAMTNQLFQVEVGKYGGGGPNLVKNSDFKDGIGTWNSSQNAAKLVKHNFYRNGQKDLICLPNSTQKELFLFSPRFELERNTDYVLNFRVFNNNSLTNCEVFVLGRRKDENTSFTIAKLVLGKTKFSTAKCEDVSVTFNSGEMDNAYIRFDNNGSSSGTADLYITEVDLYKGYKPRPWQPAPEDVVTDANANLEAIRTQMTLLQGSWAIQNLTSAGSIVSQINATNNQILIEAEKIRLKGKTLLDELTAIQGYFKRLFVGEGTFATLNADVIRTNSITADKLVMDMAMARRFVSSDLFTDTLAAKEAFINKLRSVVVTATLLEGYQGRIGGFTLGQFDHGGGRWISGVNQFSVGMGNGAGYGVRTAFWANWGNNWNYAGPKAWNVNTDGKMYCRNEVGFYDQVDFSNSSSAQFYGSTYFRYSPRFTSGIHMYDQDILGNGGSPRNSGQNAVVWWNQVGEGIVKYWMDQRSDKRLKENITDTAVKALDKINRLNMVAFDFIESKKHEEIGLIAQEVETIVPRVVSRDPENPDGYLHIDYAAFVPYLLKAIQELNQKIEKMEKTIA